MMAYTEVAIDEALAETGQLQPTELQRAMWAAYEVCGMWSPCESGVVFAQRPTIAIRVGGRLKLVWPDGFGFDASLGADS